MNVYIVEKIQHRESYIVGVYECEKQAVAVVKNEVKESDGVFDIQYYILPHVVELKYKVEIVDKCVFCESSERMFSAWLNNKMVRICYKCWCKI